MTPNLVIEHRHVFSFLDRESVAALLKLPTLIEKLMTLATDLQTQLEVSAASNAVLSEALTNVAGDITGLKDQIATLTDLLKAQEGATITADMVAQAQAVAAATADLANKAKALADATPEA